MSIGRSAASCSIDAWPNKNIHKGKCMLREGIATRSFAPQQTPQLAGECMSTGWPEGVLSCHVDMEMCSSRSFQHATSGIHHHTGRLRARGLRALEEVATSSYQAFHTTIASKGSSSPSQKTKTREFQTHTLGCEVLQTEI
jgi:hypothetical protein